MNEIFRFARDGVWPLLHGSTGEDGSIRDILELEGLCAMSALIPAAAELRGISRWPSQWSRVARMQTPDYVALSQTLFRDLDAQLVLDSTVSNLGLPVVVKPAQGGSAPGVSVVTHRSEFSRAMITYFAYGSVALIEQFAIGTEAAASVLGTTPAAPNASPRRDCPVRHS